MENRRGNGSEEAESTADDEAQRFFLTDKNTGKRRLIREMLDPELKRYVASLNQVAVAQMKNALGQMRALIPDQLQARLCVGAIDAALQNYAVMTVLEYEQNRRLNEAKPFDKAAAVDRLTTAVLDLIASKYETLDVTGIGLRATIEHAMQAH